MAKKEINTGAMALLKNKVFRSITRSKTPIFMLLMIYIVMIIIFSSLSKNYITIGNFKCIAVNMGVVGIVSAGVVIVMIAGGFDLSVGSLVGLTGVAIAKFFRLGIDLPIPVIILLALCIGAFLGAINGIIVTKLGINPLITTLGTLAVMRGLAYIWADQVARIFNPTYSLIGQGFLKNTIPYTLIYLLVIFAALAVLLKFTRFGRNIYLTGGNEHLARLAGVNTNRIKLLSYIISGIFCACAAMVLTSQLGSGRPEYGTGLELEVVIIIVLGGVTVGGGKGNYLGTFISLLILSSIINGLVLVGVESFTRSVIKGSLLIFAISLDAINNRAKRFQY